MLHVHKRHLQFALLDESPAQLEFLAFNIGQSAHLLLVFCCYGPQDHAAGRLGKILHRPRRRFAQHFADFQPTFGACDDMGAARILHAAPVERTKEPHHAMPHNVARRSAAVFGRGRTHHAPTPGPG